jgi:hypothetical protein
LPYLNEYRIICDMLYRLAWLFFLTPTFVFAQQNADCSKMSSLGCSSFNELLAAQDSGIVNAVNSDYKTSRVCFVEGEDNFVVLTVGLPPTDWRKDKNGWKRDSEGDFRAEVIVGDLF